VPVRQPHLGGPKLLLSADAARAVRFALLPLVLESHFELFEALLEGFVGVLTWRRPLPSVAA
jgi:hypothetical protein